MRVDTDTATTATSATDTTAATTATDRLEELADDLGLPNLLLEGAETCAATGGVYLRQSWDLEAADHPLYASIAPEHAVPDFRYGRLVAVTFTHEVHRADGEVWRHLERHEPGVVLHGLYVGTPNTLGRQVALDQHPATARYAPVVDLASLGDGMGRRLLVQYVPNVLPNRLHPGICQGRADIAAAAAGGFLDALDEAWSSWMRDLRLGKGRVFVPDEFLTPAGGGPSTGFGSRPRTGPGTARGFDLDTEVLSGLSIADLEQLNGSSLLTPVQFAIRVQEHADTCTQLVEAITSAAGYSPQTFGLHIDGRAESGTALRLRENKTYRTRSRKRRYWEPALRVGLENLLALDRAVWRRSTPVERPSITWPADTTDPMVTAQFVNMLRQAEAASIDTAVRLAQPDLDAEQVAAEVARIRADNGSTVGDPFAGP